jgi:Spy/CpxP family protein refolding chaperone
MKRFSPAKIMLLTILALSLCLPCLTHATMMDDSTLTYAARNDNATLTYATMRDVLALTDQQKTALKDLRIETRKNLKVKVVELRELRVQMEDTIFSEEVDTDKVNEYIAQISEMQSEISEIVTNSSLEAAQILTPEQREILSEVKEEKRVMIDEFIAKWQEIRKYLRDFLNTFERIVP